MPHVLTVVFMVFPCSYFCSSSDEIQTEASLQWVSADCTSSSSLGWRPQQEILCNQPACAREVIEACVTGAGVTHSPPFSEIHRPCRFLFCHLRSHEDAADQSTSRWRRSSKAFLRLRACETFLAENIKNECGYLNFDTWVKSAACQKLLEVIIWTKGSLGANKLSSLMCGWLSVSSSACLYPQAYPFKLTSVSS